MPSPSIVPTAEEGTLYFVMCDYGPAVGRAFVETIFAGRDSLDYGLPVGFVRIGKQKEKAASQRHNTVHLQASTERRSCATVRTDSQFEHTRWHIGHINSPGAFLLSGCSFNVAPPSPSNQNVFRAAPEEQSPSSPRNN